MKYCTYRHINQNTFETFYIGIGSLSRAYDFKTRNTHWKDYVNTNGIPLVIIERITDNHSLACVLERELISFFGRLLNNDGCLVNKTSGGSVKYNHSEHTKSLMSQIRKSENGKSYRIMLPNGSKGINNPMFGKKHSEETKKIIGNKSFGRRNKSVINKETGIFYSSIIEAHSVVTNYSESYFRQQLNGLRRNRTSFYLC